MLQNIKILLGISDDTKDALLNLLIQQAIQTATNYTHNTYSSDWDSIIMSMVIWKYSRLGNESLVSESYSGVSFTYSTATDYPQEILTQLNGYRKVRTING